MQENPVATAKPPEFRDLPCSLTGMEVEARGEKLALDQGALDRLELEKKAISATLNASLKQIRARMERTAKEIRDRQEIRSVEIRELVYADVQMMVATRADTGEVLSQRPLTPHEQQRSLFPAGMVDAAVPVADDGIDGPPEQSMDAAKD